MRLTMTHRMLCSTLMSAMLYSAGAAIVANGPVLASGVAAAAPSALLDSALAGLPAGMQTPAGYQKLELPPVTGRPVATTRQSHEDPMARLHRTALSKQSGAIGPATTHLLGLTGPSETLMVHQIEAHSSPDAHYFNAVADGSGRVIPFSKISNALYMVSFDRHMNPTAAIMRTPGQPFQAVTIDSIRPQMHQMLGFWMDWAQRNAVASNG